MTRSDIRPSVAGDMESFDDVDTFRQRIHAEHSAPGFDVFDLGLFAPPDGMAADGTAMHMGFNPRLLSGELQVFRPYAGVLVCTMDFTANDAEALHQISKSLISSQRAVSVRLFHLGKILFRFGEQTYDSEELLGLASHVPPGDHFDYRVRRGERVQLTNIVITEEGEREIWHRLGIPPCPLFDALRTNEDPAFLAQPLPNTEAFQLLAASFMHLPRSGFAQNALLRLKLGELLCLLGEVDTAAHNALAEYVPFSEVRKLSQARAILNESSEHPPSIAELGAMVGLNRRKLTEGFKKVFGDTVAGYALELRMRKGYQLLRETNLSVAEVAEQCGYEHANNFTLAFRRRFATRPSQVRQI